MPADIIPFPGSSLSATLTAARRAIDGGLGYTAILDEARRAGGPPMPEGVIVALVDAAIAAAGRRR